MSTRKKPPRLLLFALVTLLALLGGLQGLEQRQPKVAGLLRQPSLHHYLRILVNTRSRVGKRWVGAW